MDAQGAASVGERRVGRRLSYLLIVFGVLSIFFGVLWIWPFSTGFQPTYINVVPVPPSPGESCQGVVVPFPYQGSCPPNYDRLPAPLDALPIVPAIFLAVGVAAIGSALVPRIRGRILMLMGVRGAGCYLSHLEYRVSWQPGFAHQLVSLSV